MASIALQILWEVIGIAVKATSGAVTQAVKRPNLRRRIQRAADTNSGSSGSGSDSDSDSDVDAGDYGEEICAQVEAAVDTLRKSTDSLLVDSLVLAASHGGRFPYSPPVIAITLKCTKVNKDITGTSSDTIDSYTKLVNNALKASFGSDTSVAAVRQISGKYYNLSSLSANNISNASNNLSIASSTIPLHKRIRNFNIKLLQNPNAEHKMTSFVTDTATTPTVGTTVCDMPPKDFIPPFSISADLASSLAGDVEDVDDSLVDDVIHTIISDLTKIGAETTASAMVNHMISSGIVSIGFEMWKAYLDKLDADNDYIPIEKLVPYLVTAAGGVSVVAPLAGGIANLLRNFLLRPDAAKNLVLAINLTDTSFTFGGDAIAVGVRDMVTQSVHKGTDRMLAVPCGFYAHGRYSTDMIRGPCAGLSFHSEDYGAFAMGLSCVNTAVGGENAVALVTGTSVPAELAHYAANKADDASRSDEFKHQTVVSLERNGKAVNCMGRRCKTWGNSHVAICMMFPGEVDDSS